MLHTIQHTAKLAGRESIRPFSYSVESGKQPANSTMWDLAYMALQT